MPDWKKAIRSQLTDAELEPTREAEIVEELAQDLEDRYTALRSSGATEEEAYWAVLDELGDRKLLLQEFQRLRSTSNQPVVIDTSGRPRLLADLWQDVRYGLRTLRRQTSFTLVAMLTLALGVGANTAIFSVVYGVILRPLPFPEPERLLMMWTNNPSYQLGFNEFPASNSDLHEWRANATSFEQIAAFQNTLTDLSDHGDPERVGGVEITSNLLPTLGIQPKLGRQFLTEEEQPGRDRVAIISYDLWQRRFGGAADIVGKTITVNREPRTIVGVMPEGFSFPRATEMPQAYNLPEKADLWTPMAKDASFWQKRSQRGPACLIARLKPTVTQVQAQTEMDNISSQQAIAYPDTHGGWRVWLTPLSNQIIGQTRTPLLVLLGAVGFLLLIACANIASLLLARASVSGREVAIRAAIGAGRARIVRQLLTESLLLALLGGGLGLVLGYGGLKVMLSFIPPNVPRVQEVSLDAHVFLFTALISVLTSVLFGLIPAWRTSKVNLTEALKDVGRSNSAGSRIRSHSFLVTAEVALVAVLLVGALLMLQSFRRLLAVDPGFTPEGVATFQLSLPSSRYPDDERRARFFEEIRSRLSTLPGVRAVGAVSNLPLSDNESLNYIAIEGAAPVPRGKEPVAEERGITLGYFQAMGVSVVSGRDFDATDSLDKPPVVIVNETLVRQFFPNTDPVGKRIKWVLGDKDWRTIVGVVRDVRGYSLEVQARPQIYQAFAQLPSEDAMAVVVRADESVLPSLRSGIQHELKQLDSSIPVANFRTMPELVSRAIARPRFTTLLLGLFAVLALSLAVVGLYSVVAYGVTQRTREIGIRLAVGARPRDVLAMIIRQGMQPAVVGLALGLFGAFGLMRMLSNQLYEVRPTDPATFTVVAVGLLLVAFAACFIPARRAAKIDPVVALRYE